MPYRERAEAPSNDQHVELLRFVPKPWYRHRATLSLALFVLYLAMKMPRLQSWDHAWLLLVPIAIVAVGVVNCWRECATLVVSLVRDGAGRRVVIERSLGAIVRRRVFETEQNVTLATEKGEIFTRWLKSRPPDLVAQLLTGTTDPIELFATYDRDEAARFSVAMEGVEERAALVPTAEELRRAAVARERDADAKQRAIDDRYRAWFEQVISDDDVAGLDEVLARGFSLDRPIEANGNTALDLAASRGAVRCVERLIARGANASAHTLSLAAYGAPQDKAHRHHVRFVETVRVLVDSGADAYGRDRDGAPVSEALAQAGPAFVAAAKK